VAVQAFDVLYATLLSRGENVTAKLIQGADHAFGFRGQPATGWMNLMVNPDERLEIFRCNTKSKTPDPISTTLLRRHPRKPRGNRGALRVKLAGVDLRFVIPTRVVT